MKYTILILIPLVACNSPYFKMAEDIVVGEAQVVETVIEDVASIPHPKPQVTVIKKDF